MERKKQRTTSAFFLDLIQKSVKIQKIYQYECWCGANRSYAAGSTLLKKQVDVKSGYIETHFP
jgi:hypothetical protein